MAEIPWDVAIAVGEQVDEDTENATIAALTGALTLADGIVLGAAGSGIGDSGVEVQFNRDFVDVARLSNFTLQASNFVREAIEGLSVAWQLKGSCITTPSPPVVANFVLPAGYDALLSSFALDGASLGADPWSAGEGHRYSPAAVKYLTVKLWLGNKVAGNALAWVFKSVVSSGSMLWVPGQVGLATASMEVGSVTAFAEEAFPTLDFSPQDDVSAPIVRGVAHAWGATRGFQRCEVNFSNEIEQVEDSNATSGFRPRVTDRLVEFSMDLFSDDADLDYERSVLVASAHADDATFTVGTGVAAGGDVANAYLVTLGNLEARSLAPLRIGNNLGWKVEGVATGATANTDFYFDLI